MAEGRGFEIYILMNIYKLVCELCYKHFLRSSREVATTRIKNTQHTFCSKQCYNDYFRTKQTVFCLQCNKKFQKRLSQIAKTKNNFCSKSCAAKYNNTHKIKGTRVSKLEIWLQQSLSQKYSNIEFHFNRKDTINSELDIFIPSLKLAFELNGIFHYEPIYGNDKLEKILNNDNRKFQACLEQEIELCIIDTSQMKNFKEQKAIQYLDIIISIIDKRIRR